MKESEKKLGKHIDIDCSGDSFWHSYIELIAVDPVDKSIFKICHLSNENRSKACGAENLSWKMIEKTREQILA